MNGGNIRMSELQSKSLPLLSNARLELASLRRRIVLRGDCPRCREALELIDSEIVRGQDRCCWCKTVFLLPEALVESRVKTLEAEAEAKKKEARRIVEARAAKRAEQAARLAEVRSRAPQLRTDTPRSPRWAILHQPVDKFLEWCLFAGILSAVAAVAVFLGWQVLKFGVFVVRSSSLPNENSVYSDDFARKYVAKERLKASLRDPDSLEIISSDVDSSNGVTIKYRARNGFGGMSVETFHTK
jgi:hypothetical protein